MKFKMDPQLRQRVLDISKKYELCHIGSNLSALPIIDHIYQIKKDDEKFILSCGHSGIALYVVLEKYYGIDAEEMYKTHGIHSTRCEESKVFCSTGSLGNGLPIALGMSLADRSKYVYCLISDGESMEGSIWESLRLADKFNCENLKIYVNANGWGGIDKINLTSLEARMKHFFLDINFVTSEPDPFPGIEAHYRKLE